MLDKNKILKVRRYLDKHELSNKCKHTTAARSRQYSQASPAKKIRPMEKKLARKRTPQESSLSNSTAASHQFDANSDLLNCFNVVKHLILPVFWLSHIPESLFS